MANIDLKNLKVEDLKEQILKFADKKTLIKIGKSLEKNGKQLKTHKFLMIFAENIGKP